MYTFTLIKKSLNNEKIKWYNAITYILSTIYAANQEQMAAILFGIFTIYIIYLIATKKIKTTLNKTTVLTYILIIASLIFILVCPGNAERKSLETSTWFPEYADYGIGSKVILGITSMMQYLIIYGRMVFILFTAVMAYYIIKKYENPLIKVIGLIPFVGSIFYSVFGDFVGNILPSLSSLMSSYSERKLIITSENIFDISYWGPMIIYIAILGSILINIFLIFGNNAKGKSIAIIYLAGLASRFILGFSPTVFASGERTSMFLYFTFVIITILIFEKILEDNKKVPNIVVFYIILSCLALLNNFSM